MSFSNSEVLTEFQKAPQELRHNFLTELSSNFHPSDWHHLHSLLAARSYYIDFLIALPVELSLQVLQYIPPAQTILLRSVSRRYNDLLTSPETCRFLAHRHFPSSAPPAGLWVGHYENILSRRLRFEQARPSSIEKIPNGQSPSSFSSTNSTLASTVGRNRVQVHLLTTSPPTLIFPPKPMSNRGSIDYLALTSSIVAAISNDNCQVWNLSTQATHSFRLPSALVTKVHASSNMVAILIRNALLIHDVPQKKTKIFENVFEGILTPWQCSLTAFSIIVHEPTRCIWVIAIPHNGHDMESFVARLCLDTAAVMGPVEKLFGLKGGGEPMDGGSGVWNLGRWRTHRGHRGLLEVTQFQINIDRSTEGIRVDKYSLEVPDGLKSSIGTPRWGVVSTWRDINLAYVGRQMSNIIWDKSKSRARGISIEDFGPVARSCWGTGMWMPNYLHESFAVVEGVGDEKGWSDLAILRFDGVHDNESRGS